jgi:hypothetical protein
MLVVLVRVRVRGGSGRAAEGGSDGGAGTASAPGSLFTIGSSRKEDGCERVAELVGASGLYATSEAAHGMKGFPDNSH